jgi:hypothetical protein
MAEELQQSRSFKLKSVVVEDRNGKTYNITDLVGTFTYAEKITSPFIAGSLVISDSAGSFNLIAYAGGEKIYITLTDVIKNANDESDTTYEMRVWKIANRYVKERKQHYTLGLVSAEALVNEASRVATPLSGKPEKIIEKDLIKGYLHSDKKLFSDPSEFEIKLLPNRRRPFEIANNIASKCIPQQKKSGGSGGSSGNLTTETIEGTAGYFFWESSKGYNFYSVDSLCKLKDDDRPPWGPYVEDEANKDTSDNQLTVMQANFTAETDIMTNLRIGKYSTLMIFFNPSTGQYDEYTYKLKDSYNKMEHLGSGELDLIPSTEIDLSDYPTRYMSVVLDHETWFSSATPASPESRDASSSPAPFPDWQKYFMAQSIARYSTLKNQQCTVVIPGNSKICAGDRIEIKLKNKVPGVDLNNEPFDLESSGVYLIDEVTHTFDTSTGTNGVFSTTLRLFRDAYGSPDTASNHK